MNKKSDRRDFYFSTDRKFFLTSQIFLSLQWEIYPLPYRQLFLLKLHRFKLLFELYSRQETNLWDNRFCAKLPLFFCSFTREGYTKASKISKLENPSSRQNLWELFHEVLDHICDISSWEWRKVCKLSCKLFLSYLIPIHRTRIPLLWIISLKWICLFYQFEFHHSSWLLESKKRPMLKLFLMICFFFKERFSSSHRCFLLLKKKRNFIFLKSFYRSKIIS